MPTVSIVSIAAVSELNTVSPTSVPSAVKSATESVKVTPLVSPVVTVPLETIVFVFKVSESIVPEIVKLFAARDPVSVPLPLTDNPDEAAVPQSETSDDDLKLQELISDIDDKVHPVAYGHDLPAIQFH